MAFVHFSFDTPAFTDSAEIKKQNLNEIAGHALAVWLAGELAARGLAVSEVLPEDHGWDFDVMDAGRRFHCACSINIGTALLGDAHVVIGPKVRPGDIVATAIGDVLRKCPDIQQLKSESFER